MRVIFCGTPKVAVPSLLATAEGGRNMLCVLTQPDRPAGRGLRTKPSAVKTAAVERGWRVLEPERPRDIRAELEQLRPDVIVVVAYGHIFRQWLLDLPPLGCVNVHFSLLPRHRGPAPVAWAIVDGDPETGVTTMRLDAGVDTGPVYLAERVAMQADDTQDSLGARLADAGAGLLARTLEGLAAGTVTAKAQPVQGATHARLLTAEDGRVDWTASARVIDRRVRGLSPWPGAFTVWRGKRLGLHRVRVLDGSLEPGCVAVEKSGARVGTGDGIVELVEVQPEGKSVMPGDAWARGARPQPDERLGL